MQGGAIWGLSQALYEKLTYEDGRTEIQGLTDYPMLSNGEIPPIDIALIEEPGRAPAGAGEVGVPSVIAAVCNAMEADTGHELNELPLTV